MAKTLIITLSVPINDAGISAEGQDPNIVASALTHYMRPLNSADIFAQSDIPGVALADEATMLTAEWAPEADDEPEHAV